MCRICRYRVNDVPKLGFYFDSYVVDVNELFKQLGSEMRIESIEDLFLDHSSLREQMTVLYGKAEQTGTRIANFQLLPPVERPGKFICLAGNYMEHLRERDGEAAVRPKDIHAFVKVNTSVIGPNDDVVAGKSVDMLDYELELGVVIGKRGRYIPVEKAAEHIGGYFVANDIGDRSFMPEVPGGRIHWLAMKAQDTFAPYGPCILLREPGMELSDLKMRIWINGELRQSVDPSQMVFSPEETIARLSQWMTLEPGDLIITGTPAGNAWSRKQFLKEGDVMRAEMDRVGAITNRVTFEDEIYRFE